MTDTTRDTIARSVNVIEGRDCASPVTDTARPAHTAGPWTNHGGSIRDWDGNPVATTDSNESTANQTSANGRLIASAPDLLAALQAMLTRLDLEPVGAVFPCSGMRSRLRRVIAQATSREGAE